jgi:glyoxylate/hydroxypyruvate reductase A
MGKQTARCLRDSGFDVRGWSRSAHTLEGVQTYAGDAQLPDFLAPLDLVVCLLPLTAATHSLCDAAFFGRMKPGAAFVNGGRGEQVVLPELLAALDSGHLRGAVLDVFNAEPLAADDPLWRHPRLCITPHMASSASDATIVQQIIGNVLRLLGGQDVLHTMDRERGY